MALAAGALVGLLAALYFLWLRPAVGGASAGPLTSAVSRGTLRIAVSERGNLESCLTVDGICEVSGYDNKIIFIVPEGTEVKPGDEVVRIDTDKIDKLIAQQEISLNEAKAKMQASEQELAVQRNQSESDVTQATLDLTLARLDLRKYQEGDYKVEWNDRSGAIADAKFQLEKLKEDLENIRRLVKKGFKEPAYLRQREEEVRKLQFYLDRDERKLAVLETFDRERKLAELEAKAVETEKKLKRAQATAVAKVAKLESDLASAKANLGLRERDLEETRKQRERCTISAKQPGIVAYANEDWYGSDRRIREGAMIHFRQKIFSLPDMTKMQVKVNVHESQVKKVKTGQKTRIRVDAFPNLSLAGTVTSVSQLADSSHAWMRGGVKEYTTIVAIDQMPEEQLKPGMTAEVEIQVTEIPDALMAPVQAVTERRREHYVYVADGDDFERRKVTVGESNQRMVEIRDGLVAGQRVALDARARAIEDFGEDDGEMEEEAPAQPKAAPPAAVPATALR